MTEQEIPLNVDFPQTEPWPRSILYCPHPGCRYVESWTPVIPKYCPAHGWNLLMTGVSPVEVPESLTTSSSKDNDLEGMSVKGLIRILEFQFPYQEVCLKIASEGTLHIRDLIEVKEDDHPLGGKKIFLIGRN